MFKYLRNFTKIFMAAIILMTVFNGTCSAEIKEITTHGFYNAGNGDAYDQACEKAREDAKRRACEEAGVFINSYTETKNQVLTEDVVKMFSSNLIEIISAEYKSTGTPENYTVEAILVSRVDTTKITNEMIESLRTPKIVEVEKIIVKEAPPKVIYQERPKLTRRIDNIILDASHLQPIYISDLTELVSECGLQLIKRREKNFYEKRACEVAPLPFGVVDKDWIDRQFIDHNFTKSTTLFIKVLAYGSDAWDNAEKMGYIISHKMPSRVIISDEDAQTYLDICKSCGKPNVNLLARQDL